MLGSAGEGGGPRRPASTEAAAPASTAAGAATSTITDDDIPF